MPTVFGSTKKSNEISAIDNLKTVIDQYFLETGRLPTTWSEMIEDGILQDPTLEIGRKYLKFESRYFFPETSNSILIGSRSERVIAMAIQSGSEGDYPDRLDVSSRAGRWLFVRMPSGKIETRRYSEVVLAQLFKTAGFSLEDYTGSNGKWSAVDQKVRDLSKEEVGLSEAGAPKIKHSGTGEEKSSATPSKERLTEDPGTKVVLFWIFAVLIFMLSIGGYWLSKKR